MTGSVASMIGGRHRAIGRMRLAGVTVWTTAGAGWRNMVDPLEIPAGPRRRPLLGQSWIAMSPKSPG